MQVIDDLGSGGRLGSALGTGLQQIAQNKLMQLQKQYDQQFERSRYAQGLAPILGKDTAAFLSNLNPEERKYALQNIGSLMQLQNLQSPQAQGGISALAEGQAPQEAPQVSDRAQLIEDIFTSPHEKREKEKLELKKQQMASQEKLAAFKETKPERKEILNEAKSAKDTLARLDRMDELSKKGKLDSPIYLELLKKSGFDVPALTSPDSQEFRKLEVDFLRDAKNIFGARVTNYEASQFLKAIPSLSQSKEGRERVIRNLKLINEGKLVRADALKEILKENKGTPPLDLAEQVEERVSPKIDKLLSEFRRGAEGKVQKTFNDLPPASEFNGRKIRDKESGKILQSNGSEWIPLE